MARMRQCAHCLGDFEPSRSGQRYCSGLCAERGHHRSRKGFGEKLGQVVPQRTITAVCPCGTEFTHHGQASRVYCSNRCRSTIGKRQQRHSTPRPTRPVLLLMAEAQDDGDPDKCRGCGHRIGIKPLPHEDQRLCTWCNLERYQGYLPMTPRELKEVSLYA